MSFEIDFETGKGQGKVDTLAASVKAIAASASEASEKLEAMMRKLSASKTLKATATPKSEQNVASSSSAAAKKLQEQKNLGRSLAIIESKHTKAVIDGNKKKLDSQKNLGSIIANLESKKTKAVIEGNARKVKSDADTANKTLEIQKNLGASLSNLESKKTKAVIEGNARAVKSAASSSNKKLESQKNLAASIANLESKNTKAVIEGNARAVKSAADTAKKNLEIQKNLAAGLANLESKKTKALIENNKRELIIAANAAREKRSLSKSHLQAIVEDNKRSAKIIESKNKSHLQAIVEDNKKSAKMIVDDNKRSANIIASKNKSHLQAIVEDNKRSAKLIESNNKAHTNAIIENNLRASKKIRAINRSHTQAIIEDHKRAAKATVVVKSAMQRLSETRKRDSSATLQQAKGLTLVSTKTRKYSKELKQLTKALHGADQAAAGMRATLNGANAGIGIFTGRTILTATAFYALTSAIKTVITSGVEFDREMIRATRIMGATKDEAAQLDKRVRSLARSTVFQAKEVAAGLTFLAMAGMRPVEAFHALKPTLDLAKIGMISFARSADIVTNVMRAFFIEAEGVGRVSDVLSVAITSSNATIEQLAQSLSYVGPIAAATGESLEATAAILATLHDAGIKSSRAGTALRRAYANLLAPADKARKVFYRLGITTVGTNGHMLSMITIMKKLAKSGATAADMISLFGVRAAPAMVTLLRDLQRANPRLDEQVSLLEAAAGAAKKLGEEIEEHLGADAKKMISALHDKFLDLYNLNSDDLRGMMQDLTRYIKNFDIKKVADFANSLKNLAVTLKDNIGLILTMAKYLIGFTILRTIAAMATMVAGGFGLLAGALTAFMGTATGAALGMAGLSSAMLGVRAALLFMAGPWGVVIVAVTALIALFAALGSASDKSTKKLEKNADVMDRIFRQRSKKYENSFKHGMEIPASVAKTFGDDLTNKSTGGTRNEMENHRKLLRAREEALREHNQTIDRMETGRVKRLADLTKEANIIFKNGVKPGFEFLGKQSLISDGMKAYEADIKRAKAEVLKLQEEIEIGRAERKHYSDTGGDADGGESPIGKARRINEQVSINDAVGSVSFKDQIDGYFDEIAEYKKEQDILERFGMHPTAESEQLMLSKIGAAMDKAEVLFKSKTASLKEKMKFYTDNGVTDNGDGSYTREVGSKLGTGQIEDMNKTIVDIKELNAAMDETRKKAASMNEQIKLISFGRIFKDLKFDRAAKEMGSFNDKLREQIEVEQAKAAVFASGIDITDKYTTATERLKVAIAERRIQDQAAQLADAEWVKNQGPELIAIAEAKLALLIAETKESKRLLEVRNKLKIANKESGASDAETKSLNPSSFLKGQSKIDYDYNEDLSKMREYFSAEAAAKDIALEQHAEWLIAKAELDADYYEKSNEGIAKFFDSMGASISRNIADVLTYSQSWAEAAQNIRGAILGGIVGGLIDVGIQEMKNWIFKMMAQKALDTQKVVGKGKEIAMENKLTASKVAGGVAETAAASANAGIMTKLIGEGAAMAAAWIPAAWAVTVASKGTNQGPAVKALFATAAAAVAAAGIAGAGGMAVGAVTGGRSGGGRVEKNKRYLVGELGREEFIPDQQGFILSHSKLKQMEQAGNSEAVYDVDSGDVFSSNKREQDYANFDQDAFAGLRQQEYQPDYDFVQAPTANEDQADKGESVVEKASSPFKDDAAKQEQEPFQIINVIDPDLVRDYMESDDGERIVINIMRKNS